MDAKSDEGSEKKKSCSKIILAIILILILAGIVVGIVFLVKSQNTKDASYSDDPTVFCENNPEHVLCGDEEISYWDDPVNFCLKYPDDEGCEKTGEPDYCEKHKDSVLCDKNPDNDFDWINDYLKDSLGDINDSELTKGIYDLMSSSLIDFTSCINDAGFHIDSLDSFEELSKGTTLEDTYNVAQMNKINTCGENFKDAFSDLTTDEE